MDDNIHNESINDGRPWIITINGNISSLKTTFMELLTSLVKISMEYIVLSENISLDKPIVETVYEPVERWITDGWLEKFYSNPDKYEEEFQEYVNDTIIEEFEKVLAKKPLVILIERDILSRVVIFGSNLEKTNKIAYDRIYKSCYDRISRYPIYKHITMDSTPISCKKRKEHRLRRGESNIDIGYLNGIDDKTMGYFNKFSNHYNIKLDNEVGVHPSVLCDQAFGIINMLIADIKNHIKK
jgi:deoxyadenosine/deoxycytidine kinase